MLGVVHFAATAMFCPKCKVEYRPGFTRCSDCVVELVDALRDEDGPSDEAWTTIWECADQDECVGVCRELRAADIRYHVDEITGEVIADMRVVRHYRILISPNELGRAKDLLDIDAPQNTIPGAEGEDEEAVEPSVELADAGVPFKTDRERRRRYLEPWYAEDAIVEVWSQDGEDLSEGIESALDANCIHSRCDSESAGRKTIFVLAEDESVARGIVREIIDRAPLE